MKKRQLSRRERDMMEEAITRVCKAMGIPEKDPELRQVAWAALLDVYRDDPAGFTGGRMWGWRWSNVRHGYFLSSGTDGGPFLRTRRVWDASH